MRVTVYNITLTPWHQGFSNIFKHSPPPPFSCFFGINTKPKDLDGESSKISFTHQHRISPGSLISIRLVPKTLNSIGMKNLPSKSRPIFSTHPMFNCFFTMILAFHVSRFSFFPTGRPEVPSTPPQDGHKPLHRSDRCCPRVLETSAKAFRSSSSRSSVSN